MINPWILDGLPFLYPPTPWPRTSVRILIRYTCMFTDTYIYLIVIGRSGGTIGYLKGKHWSFGQSGTILTSNFICREENKTIPVELV